MRLTRLIIAFALLWIYAPASAQFELPVPIRAPTAAGGATTTFDPSNKGTGLSLSGGNLTATVTTNSWYLARTITSHASGKYYAEFTVVTGSGGANAIGVGLGTSSANLNDYLGSDANAVSYYGGDGAVYFNGSAFNTFGTYGNAAVVGEAMDVSNGRLCYTIDGTHWQNDNTNLTCPTLGTNAINISTFSPSTLYMYVSLNKANAGNAVITGNFGGSAYTYTVPTGYGNM